MEQAEEVRPGAPNRPSSIPQLILLILVSNQPPFFTPTHHYQSHNDYCLFPFNSSRCDPSSNVHPVVNLSLTGVIQCCTVDTVTDLHDQLHPSIVNIPLTNLLPANNFTQEQQGFNRALCYSIGRLTATAHAHNADEQNCDH